MQEFKELTQNDMLHVEGGLLGLTWLTGSLLIKVFGGAAALGGAGAAAYFGTK